MKNISIFLRKDVSRGITAITLAMIFLLPCGGCSFFRPAKSNSAKPWISRKSLDAENKKFDAQVDRDPFPRAGTL